MEKTARVGIIGCKPLPLIINLPRVSQVSIQIVPILIKINKLLPRFSGFSSALSLI